MATHAENQIPGLTAERAKALTTLVVTLLMAVNAALSFAGRNPLPFSETEAYTAISGVLAFTSTLYSWWKNQNVTTAAIAGQTLTASIKSGTQGTSQPPTTTASLEDSLTSTGFDDIDPAQIAGDKDA